ncbi:MAG: hypothetical protein OQJ81_04015 [Melioribacteraceae bacterium]|nr:hypothetical protein [Melioribacteraceae bacterium]
MENYHADSNIVFDLCEKADSVRLRLKIVIVEGLPDDIPEFKQESEVGGWEYFIQNRFTKNFNLFRNFNTKK